MSDSLENMAEMQSEVTQPVDVVVTDTEETVHHKLATKKWSLYIEAEGDQSEEPKDGLDEEAKLSSDSEKKDRQRKEERLTAAANL